MNSLPRDYKNLEPTVLSEDQCHSYLDELLDFVEKHEVNEVSAAEAFSEMVARFSDNYLPFKISASERMITWAKNHWKKDSFDFLDAMTASFAYSGLDSVVIDFVKQCLTSDNYTNECREVLEEFLQEMSE